MYDCLYSLLQLLHILFFDYIFSFGLGSNGLGFLYLLILEFPPNIKSLTKSFILLLNESIYLFYVFIS